MAGLVQDCFSIGSTVECTTCYNANIEGEVLAFDQQTKMLILSILFQSGVKVNPLSANGAGWGRKQHSSSSSSTSPHARQHHPVLVVLLVEL